MSTETWSDEPALPPAPLHVGTPIGAPSRRAGPLARTTVLPRLEQHGEGAPTVVRERQARYDGLEELGRGGLGVVLGARDRDIGRRVAIKQLRDDRTSPKALLRFAEEIRTVGKLDHPNIAPVHDVGVDAAGHPYFVMKYVQGETMSAVIAALRRQDPEVLAKWTVTRRLEVFRKVLAAVGFAHAQGIVHRDLKPENLMIGAHGEVHVLDWGIAHRDTAADLSGVEGDDPMDGRVTHTRDGAVIGTPHYMSPEQARGQPVDARSDIYSLGVVLHEWLTGRHYLEDMPDIEAVLEGVTSRDLPDETAMNAQGVPAELGWIVRGAVDKDPDKRFGSIAEWLDRLDRRDEGNIPVQCPITFQKRAMYEAERFLDRHPALWMAGLGVLFATVVTGAGLAVVGAFALGALIV